MFDSSMMFTSWPHYKVFAMENVETVFAIFPNADDVNDMNLLITGTSGVHGSYVQADQLLFRTEKEEEAIESYEDTTPGTAETDELTVLIVHSRLCVLRYGTLTVTREQAERIMKLQLASVAVINKTWGRTS